MLFLGRSVSPFQGKNLFQNLRQASRLIGAKRKCFEKQRKSHQFTLTGPGCRAGLNLLSGFPKTWNLGRGDASTASVYSALAVKWLGRFRTICREALAAQEWPAPVLAKVATLLQTDEVQFQFHLCELSKAVAFLVHRRQVYLRKFHQAQADKENAP